MIGRMILGLAQSTPKAPSTDAPMESLRSRFARPQVVNEEDEKGKDLGWLERSMDEDMLPEMNKLPPAALGKLQSDFAPFCRKYNVRSLAVFGSLARGTEHPGSDLDLLVDPSMEATVADILEMAGEAEEIAGRPVDFVLRNSLLKTADRDRADHILSTAVFLYGD